MNGVHDMGGMHGFGPVKPEANEPVFHAPWEGRVLALRRAVGAWRRWNIDAGRYSIETLPPADYLRLSYYEKWFESAIKLVLDAGLVTQRELETGHRDPSKPVATPPLTVDKVMPAIMAGGPTLRETSAKPRFTPGQAVRARDINPIGHTRLPRYVRGRRGTIECDHGAHVFPDSNARFEGENPQFLYTVRFEARDLWGEAANPADAVYLDLWDDYLDAV
ncbi:nitrile hydratase subunit beta [Reyranella sp.]|uniref:nitrile hydratase subunit beta n=1 Tax=Reyranella sp. TaxID=1929291 RepID=UPI003D0DF7D0